MENKYDAIVDLEFALAHLTATSTDAPISSALQLLENEANALNAVLDGSADPSISTVSPADATALQNAILKAEDTIKQAGSLQSLLNSAAVLAGTVRQSRAA